MTGCERLKSMIEGSFQRPLFKIYLYLKKRTDMDEKYLNPEKNLKQMYEYIKRQAEKQAVDGVAILEDSFVYNLAIQYFNETNENLGIKDSSEISNKGTEEENNVKDDNVKKNEDLTLKNIDERKQISLFMGTM